MREIVELHGGEVSVDQAPEGGARFIVSLPRGDVEASELRVETPRLDVDSVLPLDRERAAPTSLRPCGDRPLLRVLIAEDNPEMNRFLRESLADGWRVEAVFDGREGIRPRRRQSPRPHRHRHDDAARERRGARSHAARESGPSTRRPSWCSRPALDEALRFTRALRSGARDFISKPFSV